MLKALSALYNPYAKQEEKELMDELNSAGQRNEKAEEMDHFFGIIFQISQMISLIYAFLHLAKQLDGAGTV